MFSSKLGKKSVAPRTQKFDRYTQQFHRPGTPRCWHIEAGQQVWCRFPKRMTTKRWSLYWTRRLLCQSSRQSRRVRFWMHRRSGRCRCWESRKQKRKPEEKKSWDGMIPNQRSIQHEEREHGEECECKSEHERRTNEATRFNNRVNTRYRPLSEWK